MTFSESIKTCLLKYATFSGTASRSEFWWFAVFQFLVGVATNMIDAAITPGQESGLFAGIAGLALLLPGLAAAVRRLHDVGRSGWWYLLIFTGVGVFVLLYWYVQPSGEPYQES